MPERIQLIGDPDRPSKVVQDPETIENPVLAFFADWWKQGRGTGGVPDFANFSPKDCKQHLGSIVLSEALPEYSDFRYRLIGSRVTEYFLQDATGKTITEAFRGTVMGPLVTWLHRLCCEIEAPVRMTGPASVISRVFFPDYDTLYLPYSSTGGRPDRVVNVFTFNSDNLLARKVDTNALPEEILRHATREAPAL